MGKLEELKRQKSQIEKEIRKLQGFSSGNYVVRGSVRFGKPHLSSRRYTNEIFELAVFNPDKQQFRKFIWFQDLINSRNGIKKMIGDLENILQVIEENPDKWIK